MGPPPRPLSAGAEKMRPVFVNIAEGMLAF